MDDTFTLEPTPEEADQIQQYIAEIVHLRERMRQDQIEIEASRAITDIMLTRIAAQLAQLQAS